MDNLTHTAIGLFLSRAGLNRLTPRATAILLLAANAPDIDVVSAAGGPLNYVHYHRHITHSLAAMPLMALLVLAVVRFAGRKPIHWKGALLASFIGLASHVLLDWTNIYGVRMLLPFSVEWLRLDTTNVIDIWIWAVCLLGIAGPFLARLVGSEIASGSTRARHHGRGFAIFAILFVLLYNSGRGVLHARTVASLSSRLYEGETPRRVMAGPDTVNPFRWRGLIETEGSYIVQDVNLASPDPVSPRPQIFHKPEADPALDAARKSETILEFLRFSQYPLWRVTPFPELEGARLVEIYDMRFGSPAAPGFMATAVVDSRNQVVRSDFAFGSPRAH